MTLPTRLVLTLALLAPLGACHSFRGAIRDIHNEDMVGRQAPELVGGSWIGKSEILPASARINDWTVVAFFRPWDSACVEDVPRLARLQSSYQSRGVRVLAVTEAPAERALEFIEAYAVPYPVLTDAQALEDAYQVEMLWGSEVFLVDPGGIVVADNLPKVEEILREELGSPLGN